MDESLLNETVRRLATVFQRRTVSHALIGGMAVGFRTNPRSTKDADFLVQIPALLLPKVLEDLVEDGFDINVMDSIRRWSTDRFLAFYIGSVRVDWLQPILPIYAKVLESAKSEPWLGTNVNVATAEGLILTKMIAYRIQDQADVVALLSANRDVINIDWIREEWSSLAIPEIERTKWLEDAIQRYVPPR